MYSRVPPRQLRSGLKKAIDLFDAAREIDGHISAQIAVQLRTGVNPLGKI
jgi:hypothetical protein